MPPCAMPLPALLLLLLMMMMMLTLLLPTLLQSLKLTYCCTI